MRSVGMSEEAGGGLVGKGEISGRGIGLNSRASGLGMYVGTGRTLRSTGLYLRLEVRETMRDWIFVELDNARRVQGIVSGL